MSNGLLSCIGHYAGVPYVLCGYKAVSYLSGTIWVAGMRRYKRFDDYFDPDYKDIVISLYHLMGRGRWQYTSSRDVA